MIFIAISSHGGNVSTLTFRSVLRLQNECLKAGIGFNVRTLDGCSVLTHARNHLVQNFLASDYETMLFLDADIGFNSHGILRALKSPYDVVCGVYSFRDGTNTLTIEKKPSAKPGPDGFIEIKAGGTGCMLIKRRVLQRMTERHPETYGYRSAERIFHHLFDIDYEDGGLVGEDYAFCRRWCAMDCKIHADTKVDMVHIDFQFQARSEQHLSFSSTSRCYLC
jgi:hypothetical protein